MKPFLLLSVRADDAAADNEYESFMTLAGLAEDGLRRVRLEQRSAGDIDLRDFSGVWVGGGPFNYTDPQEGKTAVQLRVEADLSRVLDAVVAADFPFQGACYGLGALGRHEGAVLGSLNMDITVTVPRLPGPGATVLGSAARFAPGGKGANQAVAAARLGADVRMAGCVGDDDFGRLLLARLRAEEVNADAVRTVTGAATGVAMITVDRGGENIITVAPGANHEVGSPEVAAAASASGILVISAEIDRKSTRLNSSHG